MSCSCGSATCLCGIPCSCSVESCKCDACAIGLSSSCKICNKPVPATHIQTDEITCSCFVGGPKALMFENENEPQFRMGNLPIPASDGCYVYAKLLVNIMIPMPSSSQFAPQEHVCLESTSQSAAVEPPPQADSRYSLPTFISEEDIIIPGSAVSSASELHKLLHDSREQSNHRASTSIGSSDVNTKKFHTENLPRPVSECKIKTDCIVQNTRQESEGSENVHKQFFYLPSIIIDDVSYPVEMADPIWRFSATGNFNSSLNLCNPFYVTEVDSTIQADTILTIEKTEETLVPTEAKEQPNLQMYDKHGEFATSLTMATGNEYIDMTGNSNSNIFPERPTSLFHHKFPGSSNENLPSEIRDHFSLKSHQYKFAPTSGARCNDRFQPYSENYSVPDGFGTLIPGNLFSESVVELPSEKLQGPLRVHESPLTFSSTPRYLNESTSKFQTLLNMGGTRTPEQNDYLRGIKPEYGFENKENAPIPLYVDPGTTRKMVKLLKPTRK